MDASAAVALRTGDTAWVLTSCSLVLLMTPGLSFFYGGLVKERNLLNTMMMSLISIGVVSIVWASVGFTLAFGDGGPFIGNFQYAWLDSLDMQPWSEDVHACHLAADTCESLKRDVPGLLFAIFQMTFAIIAAAIMSGSLVERLRFVAYVIFVPFWVILVYCPLCHWVWGPGGWLEEVGALDFAGGTVVHISSGVSGLVAAIILGPRSKLEGDEEEATHNVPFVLLGASLLWFGWGGFNSGSALAADIVAVQALACTYLTAATSMMTWVFLEWAILRKPSSVGAMIGAVAGLILITPAAGFVTPRGGMLMGLMGTPLCFLSCRTINKLLRVDDSLDAFGLHGVGGIVGAILTGVFSVDGGLFYGGGMALIGKQALGALVGAAYAAFVTAAIFFCLSRAMHVRVSEEDEMYGLDARAHGEVAYSRTPKAGTPNTNHSPYICQEQDDDSGSSDSGNAEAP
eukprot:TRINITY_DN12394_c0_g3_i1.p1 TRINITY_DN12394_c0_g3~~TRINITY_DN12394_c0_g3_i1.p1  ORF type:complete len:476 (+),score=80.75 TRINITY_DN12394_c0_g3_i1:57-1430(+)